MNDNCIKCKHMDCVEVDCFYEGERFCNTIPITNGVCDPQIDAIVQGEEDNLVRIKQQMG